MRVPYAEGYTVPDPIVEEMTVLLLMRVCRGERVVGSWEEVGLLLPML